MPIPNAPWGFFDPAQRGEVLCGICGARCLGATAKARHLERDHGCVVRPVQREGRLWTEWQRAPSN